MPPYGVFGSYMLFCKEMAPKEHPFDRYAAFTDLPALLDFSAKPLRKSVRVNTLKSSVEDFKKWAEEKKWILTQVPWSKEAFFIDREDRSNALGKDLMHLMGHFYMQEAASMLPVELLQPEAGEAILDMSAAPGSKTTQIAGKQNGRGVILANDVQEKRLWTLKTALHRSGVSNVIVSKKVGQWFAKHMTERFDRVLCDAPCTAEGTARKDSDALKYCSIENTKSMASLQHALLESAVHAAKVGGRIVYSTCTLTPEENEGVILYILNKFPDQLEVVDPRTLNIAPEGYWEKALADSAKVQQLHFSPDASPLPLIRLWPQTYDTEGFFSAVLRKKAPTRYIDKMVMESFQEKELSRRRKEEIASMMEQRYGFPMVGEEDRLFSRGEMILLSNNDAAHFELPVQNYSLGLPFGKMLKDGRILIGHEIATLRGHQATKNVFDVDHDQLEKLLSAQDIDCPAELDGHVIIRYRSMGIGLGLAKNGRLKNNIPRWIVQMG